nr:unnamed protein product [Callosobruchus analis]
MPKVKDKSKYTKKYDEDSLQLALADIENGMPKLQAPRKHGIPRQTLQFRLSKKFKRIGHGPSSYLTEEEDVLQKWIMESFRKGFPRRRHDIQTSMLIQGKIHLKTIFLESTGIELSSGVTQKLLFAPLRELLPQVAVSESDIRSWFNGIEAYLKEKNYFRVLQSPARVYNADESGFVLCPQGGKVLAQRGARNVYEASGEVAPPLVVYPYKSLPAAIVKTVPDDWGVGHSDNGWMKSELFMIILFVDGHKTHITYELSNLCIKLQIILIVLYPNATKILQPADVACFKPLKNAWKVAVLKWRTNNPYLQLTKLHFAPILKEALLSLKKPSIINGFRACELQHSTKHKVPEVAEGDIGDSIIRVDTDITQYDIENIPILIEDEFNHASIAAELIYDYNVSSHSEVSSLEKSIDLPTTSSTLTEADSILQNTLSSKIPQAAPLHSMSSTVAPVISDYTEISNLEATHSSEVSTSTETVSIASNKNSTQGIYQYLQWPKTPERKSLRKTEKLPYVITSTGWKKIYEVKQQEKDEKERKKKKIERRGSRMQHRNFRHQKVKYNT